MKKIAVTAALAAIAAASIAPAHAATSGTTAGGTQATSVQISPATTGIGAGVKEIVKVQLSANNNGAVVYDDTAVSYGISVGSTKGKGINYRASSGGGAPKPGTATMATIVDFSALTTDATTSAAGS